MGLGTPRFVGGRLRQARRARGILVAEIADQVGISASQIYNYESGQSSPPSDVFLRIARLLRLPRHYFLKAEVAHFTSDSILFRAKRSAGSTIRERAQERLAWLAEMSNFLLDTVEMPHLNLPPLTQGHPLDNELEDIDQVAYALREHWGLGDKPVPNVIRAMEANGFIVSLDDFESQDIDGLSGWSMVLGRPFAVLNGSFRSSSRRRFSASHELGELLLHQGVELDGLGSKEQISRRKELDVRAHRFAGAFLLPEQAFLSDLHTITLDALQAIKPKWRVSISAMVLRLRGLGLIDDRDYRNLMIGITRRGWRRDEPFEEEIPLEEPVLLRQAFQAHLEAGVTGEELAYEIGLDEKTLSQLAMLPPGFFSRIGPSNVLHFNQSA